MKRRYKIIISNKNLYKEVELGVDSEQIKIGTEQDCDIRLRRELFFERIELVFMKDQEEWSMLCSENLYVSVGDVRKMLTKSLNHGDSLEVKYQESNNTVFSLDFMIDFDSGERKYERVIEIPNRVSFNIGSGSHHSIVISGPFIMDDSIELTRRDDSLFLKINKATYGVLHNGKKANNTEEIRNGDFFSLSDHFFYYKDGKLWTEIRDDLEVVKLSFVDCPAKNQYPKFIRNTRMKSLIKEDGIEILDPPAIPQKPKNNIFTRLLPAFGMILASAFMAFMGGAMIVLSLVSGVMAIVTAVMSIRESKKDFVTNTKQRIEKYNAYIEKKRLEIEQIREDELQAMNEIYVSQDVIHERFVSFSPDLFDRIPEDEDFLCIRLGSGSIEAKRKIDYKKQERLEYEDELQLIPEELAQEYRELANAPVVCDLKAINALGIVGSSEHRFAFFKNIIIDLVGRQYHTDLKLVFVAEKEHKDQIHWLRTLPHVYCDPIGSRLLVSDDESKNLVFEYLYKELSSREQNKIHEPHMVAFFYDEYGINNHPISRFVEKAKDLGFTFVFFCQHRSEIPVGCAYVVDITSYDSAMLICAENKHNTNVFSYSEIPNEQAKKIVDILSPVYTEEISLEGSLTKKISIFQLLNVMNTDDIDLATRWKNSQVYRSMAAPLGVTKSSIVYLDLHDKAHGPHGLVAGTTGSGKSEILQTYILSMATLFHAYEVGFVIIDFKGGGMVNQFRELPHLLGAITNIDGKEVNRSLKSIKAELQKRQRLFAEVEVNHIDKYIQKFKSKEASIPLPHLIIIVDEFAELKAEQPDFMKELISAARIGRSLGVHLILATQKPSGQVNEQIWSNSRFKLCLKVQSKEDSNEVLKSPLAAEIKEPGRAYLQVGNNEIFELFQSAYSGESEKSDDTQVKEFSIIGLSDSGKRVPVFTQKKKKSDDQNVTQLDAIVKYVAKYFESTKAPKLPDICLPSLSEVIDFPEKSEVRPNSEKVLVSIGVYDDPENQYQGSYTVDLAGSNLIIIGSSQSGKTNLLQNIIRSISSNYAPNQVTIYIIDFASMVLKNFEPLKHVGGVVCPSDDEKIKNLFKLLFSEVEMRKEKLSNVGVSSFAAYKEAGETDLPQIVLLIDNLTRLREMAVIEDDELIRLCREGISVGISIVIANAQTSGMGYKYLANFSSRIALFCNDSGEYNSVFDHCRERLDNIPGRCIIEMEKRHLEAQVYLAFKGEKEIERVRNIRAYIAAINAKNTLTARIIPVIPAQLTDSYIINQYSQQMQNKYNLVVGLDYATVTPLTLDLSSALILGISGRAKSGKHNWIKYALSMLEHSFSGKTKVSIIDGISKKLSSVQSYANVVSYSIVAEDAITKMKEIEGELKARYDDLVAGDDSVLEKSDLLVLLLNNPDSVTAISNDKEAMAAYKNITSRYKNMKVLILISSIENANLSFGSPEFLKNIRDSRHLLFFDDIANLKFFDVPLSVSRNFKKPIELGDCYYMKENDCMKLKTPNLTEEKV